MLKAKLVSAPILVYPDMTRPFELHVDACGIGGGAVLCQQSATGAVQVVAYWSMIFNQAEKNYSTVERECLAMVKAITHFRPYVFGRPVTVYTDHAPLRWLNSMSSPTGRLARWSLLLSDYQIDIQYRKGRHNTDADGLSRCPVDLEGRGDVLADPHFSTDVAAEFEVLPVFFTGTSL